MQANCYSNQDLDWRKLYRTSLPGFYANATTYYLALTPEECRREAVARSIFRAHRFGR
jgi:hypothetical protein